MIVVDTSALMAVLLDEPGADACTRRLAIEDRILISAATVAEFMIVAGRRGLGVEAQRMIADLGFEVVPVTHVTAIRVAEVYQAWGKGVHPAALNFGDCFSYVLAEEVGCKLLYVGKDFEKTDMA